MKVRVIYDFSAQWSGELSVSIGEELTITNQNVGSGWWQAVNAFGKEGLIPSEFVEIIELPEPTAPPPSLPPTEFGKEIDRFDEWDDEWDSDENDTATLNKNLNDRSQQVVSKQTDSSISVPNNPDYIRTTLIRKFFPRSFIRNGGEDFLLGHDPPPFPQTEANIDLIDDTFRWRYVSSDLTSCISSFRKDSKMKGIKSFIAYQITNSLSHTQVSRRYKHFDWLHSRLLSKYPCVCIPPLPEKAITGRYEDDFVDERRKWLQQWLTRMCMHPVISHSSVFLHFLTCTDFKKWKLGKREAETDKLQGGRFYFAVETKSGHTSQDYTVEKAEAAERFLSDLDRSTKFLSETVNEYHRKLSTSIRKEFSTLSLAFLNMSKAIESDVHTKPLNTKLCESLTATGTTFRTVACIHSLQSEASINLQECLKEFTRLLPSTSNIISLAKAACLTVDELNRVSNNNSADEQKYSQSDVNRIQSGALIITRSVQAECNHIMSQIRNEWMNKIKDYLNEQARFYHQIAELIEKSAQSFQVN
uniref:Sorting nexin-18 n=1 Tax=Schistosoma japonicum TaxID=6182 RepID=C1LG69_SCHJA|nr:Sorting nexin-18 [Schistosoma japonicum]